jgi:prolycopene isomerase
MYGVAFPGLREHLPVGREAFLDVHYRHFPQEKEGLRRFVQTMAKVTRESQELSPQLAFRDLDKAVARYPTLFKYRNLTISQTVDEHIADPRARAFITTSWPYLGLPPDELSFFSWSGMIMSMLDDSPFYSRGSFQRPADAFVTALTRAGGEFVPGTTVEKILVEDGKAAGVRLAGGRVCRAPIVVSNIDARQTNEELVGPEHLPAAFLRNFRRLRPSLSAVVIYAATSVDLRAQHAAHETFVNKHWDHAETYRDVLAGRPGGMWVNVPSLIDPSLAPAGHHVVIMTSLAPFDIGKPWKDEKSRYTDALVGEIDSVFPGFKDNITHLETATPETLAHYARNSEGALYGWANTASQAGTKRPSRHSPIPGLYLAGHWSQPGSGSFRAVYSGLLVSSEIQGYEGLAPYMDKMMREAGLAGPPAPPTRALGLIQMLSGMWVTQLIYVVAKLGIPDLIVEHGPLDAPRLASMIGGHAPSIHRVRRALTTVGLFDLNEAGRFRLTPLGALLRTDIDGSVRAQAILFGEPAHWQSWGNLLHTVKTGEPSFRHTFGEGLHEFVAGHPEVAEALFKVMLSGAMQDAPGIAGHYDFGEVRQVMLVGAGSAPLLSAILSAHPHLRGVLVDFPHVVGGAQAVLGAAGLGDRCQVIGTNLFGPLPRGADAVLAWSLLQNFDDDMATGLLRGFRDALPPEGGRVLIAETVLPAEETPHPGNLFDVELLTQSDGGRHRTGSEFGELFARAGLRLTRVVPTGSPVCVVEGVPSS